MGFLDPQWVKVLPSNLRPSASQVQSLEELRTHYGIPHEAFAGLVMQSPAITKTIFEQQASELRRRIPGATVKQILAAVYETRLSCNRAPLGAEAVKLKIARAMQEVNSIDELVRLVLRDERYYENCAPDPFAINPRIEEILGWLRYGNDAPETRGTREDSPLVLSSDMRLSFQLPAAWELIDEGIDANELPPTFYADYRDCSNEARLVIRSTEMRLPLNQDQLLEGAWSLAQESGGRSVKKLRIKIGGEPAGGVIFKSALPEYAVDTHNLILLVYVKGRIYSFGWVVNSKYAREANNTWGAIASSVRFLD